jgi:hypothetical protein
MSAASMSSSTVTTAMPAPATCKRLLVPSQQGEKKHDRESAWMHI